MPGANQSTVPRLAVYGITTTILTLGVVATAFMKHEYFYTACIQLSQSGTSMMILANMGLLLTILVGKLLVRIFFGHLRTIEVERLYEQGWLSITETVLALAILRGQFDVVTLMLFVFLLFCKMFHWMLDDRVGFMEQQPRITALFLVRTVSLSAILAAVDCLVLMYAVDTTRRYGATTMIVFGFEFALLFVRFLSTCAKFVLNAINITRDDEWEGKQTYTFYIEILYDLVKLIVYLGFFVTLTVYYGFPIHIIRELYITAASFYNKCSDWLRYRKAMQNMYLRYPTVSQDELDDMSDTTCIICREEMSGPTTEQADSWNAARQAGVVLPLAGDTPKRLACNHVFHFNCLRSWLERQQSCPTCRQSVLEADGARHRAPGAPNQDQAPNAAGAPVQPHPPGDQQQLPAADTLTPDGGPELLDLQSVVQNADGARTNQDSAERNPGVTSNVMQPADAAAGSSSLGSTDPTRSYSLGDPSNGQPHSQQRSVDGALPSVQTRGWATLPPNTLIPIFPSSSSQSITASLPLLQDFPSPDLSMLSGEQISRLEADSRTAVQERIRILSALQVQLSYMVTTLTQVESLIPTPRPAVYAQESTSTTAKEEKTSLQADANGPGQSNDPTNHPGQPSCKDSHTSMDPSNGSSHSSTGSGKRPNSLTLPADDLQDHNHTDTDTDTNTDTGGVAGHDEEDEPTPCIGQRLL
ncbi:E3 ubiquitin-protein ligase hrd1 [Coemansia sp. Benny D115]|nr:E3 ubiquitin-protein ligase hrd1 [Coemansia sp. Benny D115]